MYNCFHVKEKPQRGIKLMCGELFFFLSISPSSIKTKGKNKWGNNFYSLTSRQNRKKQPNRFQKGKIKEVIQLQCKKMRNSSLNIAPKKKKKKCMQLTEVFKWRMPINMKTFSLDKRLQHIYAKKKKKKAGYHISKCVNVEGLI